MKQITLPELGEGVTEGELIKWLVSEGDTIHIDQPVAELMTDKASMEVPSPLEGEVVSFLAKPGDTIEVGKALIDLKTKVNSVEQDKSSNIESTHSSSDTTESIKPSSSYTLKSIKPVSQKENIPASEEEEDINILATPFTRKLAKELGVSLNQIKGTGLAGRVTKEDVLKQAPVAKPSTHSDFSALGFSIPETDHQKRIPLKGIRKKIAKKMQKSKMVIPHFSLMDSADVEQLDELKNSVKLMLQDQNIKITYLSFVIKALLAMLKKFPELNASIDDFKQEIILKNYYNFGFATDTPKGLLVPVIKHVDQKSLSEISFEIQNLATKAREGKIKPEEMSEGTITITNIGSLGGQYATPIINAPETSILGMYRISTQAVWDGSQFQPRKTMNFSLTCDHRLIDGATSAKALKYFIHKIENPLKLFI